MPARSGNGAAIAEGIGAAAGAVLIGELIAHHNASPKTFGDNGPQVPKEFDMNGFVIKGLVGPNWPVVLDFMVDTPGRVQIDIVTEDKRHFRAVMTNTAGRRGYGIFRVPPDFGNKVQVAVYQIQAIPPASTALPAATAPPTAATAPMTTPPQSQTTTPGQPQTPARAPGLRTYGLGAGEKAVGSVAIDELKFQPPMIHPRAKEVANYSFHSHSAFNGVRAEFIYTTLYNGHVLVQKDQDAKLPPIPEGEQARGTWEGKRGKIGEHMLQIRAWRGLENGGDWVVAWSPDIVDVE